MCRGRIQGNHMRSYITCPRTGFETVTSESDVPAPGEVCVALGPPWKSLPPMKRVRARFRDSFCTAGCLIAASAPRRDGTRPAFGPESQLRLDWRQEGGTPPSSGSISGESAPRGCRPVPPVLVPLILTEVPRWMVRLCSSPQAHRRSAVRAARPGFFSGGRQRTPGELRQAHRWDEMKSPCSPCPICSGN